MYASQLLLITLLYVTHSCQTMIIRNNALMSKMMSHISSQKDSNQQEPQHDIQRPERVLSLMQNVLCRNFPLIPCKMIVEDNALRKLIEKSIQQIKYKKLSLEKTTSRPDHLLTLFPTVNSEDLSNFLQKRERGYYGTNQKDFQTHKKKQKKSVPPTVFWLHENPGKTNKKNKKQTKRAYEYTGRKKIRKFYPHKIKYKDKIEKNARSPGDYSDEKLSMSVEVPDMTLTKRHQHLSYKVEPVEPAVWRIDYTKHGEPSVNMLGYDTDQLKGKIMKTGPNVIFDGRPAARLFVDLFKKKDNSWAAWNSTMTNADGRIQFPFTKESMPEGTYKLHFKVGDYYKTTGQETLYPFVEIPFETKEDEHYHIALLLSPYGYTTYRGS
ncbi:uncharacterized protein LOC113509360 [Galleria mellonella]|uniref:hydroxyisourate hydrolase n=1 Tax=Galleria mellonella TaxID=7137 RepID=A0A6J3C811_GALME|nr:uncharacterized protein LOC113509360 [Galleria mellonella]